MTAPAPVAAPALSNAVRPAGYNDWCKLAFYNIGWNRASKHDRHTKQGLAKEICGMVQDKGPDAVGISEVFNLKQVSLEERQERQDIMQYLLEQLNSSAALPAWTGRSDGHYIFLWNSSKLDLIEYDYVSCGIPDHPWRKAQYFQFRCAESPDHPQLHVCHDHSPPSKKGKTH